jgi:hypothetical protein
MNLGKGKYTPVLGDLIVSKWGYEALAVKQYTGNRYQRLVYETDKKLSQASHYAFTVVPKLQESLTRIVQTDQEDSVNYYTGLLKNEMIKTRVFPDVFQFEFVHDLTDIKRKDLVEETGDYLTYLSLHFFEKYENMLAEKERQTDSLNNLFGKEPLAEMREKYYNAALERTVTNRETDITHALIDKEIIQYTDNIFQDPSSNLGRARLFCPSKLLNGQKTDTIWFNLSVIWMFSAVCYLFVLFDAGSIWRKMTCFNRS